MKKAIVSTVFTAIVIAIVNYLFCVRPIQKDLYERYGAMQFLADIRRLQKNRKHIKVERN